MTYEELILLSRILLGAGLAFFALCIFLFFKLRIPAVIGDFSGFTAKKAIERYNADSAGMSNAIYRGNGDKSAKGAGSQKLSARKAKEKDSAGYKTEKIYTAKLASGTEPEPVNKKALQKEVPVIQAGSGETEVLSCEVGFGETEVLSQEGSFGETEVLMQEANFGETEVLSQESVMGETAVLSETIENYEPEAPKAQSTMGETTVLSDIDLYSFADSEAQESASGAEFEVEIDITFVHSNETINI